MLSRQKSSKRGLCGSMWQDYSKLKRGNRWHCLLNKYPNCLPHSQPPCPVLTISPHPQTPGNPNIAIFYKKSKCKYVVIFVNITAALETTRKDLSIKFGNAPLSYPLVPHHLLTTYPSHISPHHLTLTQLCRISLFFLEFCQFPTIRA